MITLIIFISSAVIGVSYALYRDRKYSRKMAEFESLSDRIEQVFNSFSEENIDKLSESFDKQNKVDSESLLKVYSKMAQENAIDYLIYGIYPPNNQKIEVHKVLRLTYPTRSARRGNPVSFKMATINSTIKSRTLAY